LLERLTPTCMLEFLASFSRACASSLFQRNNNVGVYEYTDAFFLKICFFTTEQGVLALKPGASE